MCVGVKSFIVYVVLQCDNRVNFRIKYKQEVKCAEQYGLLTKQKNGAPDISLNANVEAPHSERNTLAS